VALFTVADRNRVRPELNAKPGTIKVATEIYIPNYADETDARPADPRNLRECNFEYGETLPNLEPGDLRSELVPLAGAIETFTRPVRTENEREHRRMAISRAKAWVKSPNTGEEFVELLDVSRGGAAFLSNRVYALGSWIRIAAPCTVGAANIFLLARVVRASKAERGGREYGVEYVGTGT